MGRGYINLVTHGTELDKVKSHVFVLEVRVQASVRGRGGSRRRWGGRSSTGLGDGWLRMALDLSLRGEKMTKNKDTNPNLLYKLDLMIVMYMNSINRPFFGPMLSTCKHMHNFYKAGP